MKDDAEKDFVATLIEDALGAIERDRRAQSQASHRDLVRTLFATTEGLVSAYREHVVEAAADVGELKANERIALSEEVYVIGEQGRITTQRRYISIRAMIRLCARIAQRLDPELDIAFDGKGWTYF